MVILRDDSDPRTSVVVAGQGIPPDLIGHRFGVDEGMAGQVITHRRSAAGRRLRSLLAAASGTP